MKIYNGKFHDYKWKIPILHYLYTVAIMAIIIFFLYNIGSYLYQKCLLVSFPFLFVLFLFLILSPIITIIHFVPKYISIDSKYIIFHYLDRKKIINIDEIENILFENRCLIISTKEKAFKIRRIDEGTYTKIVKYLNRE